MTPSLLRRLRVVSRTPFTRTQGFRSNAAMEALTKASEDKIPNIVLYNYPSFSGAFSALFAHLFHSQLNLPCLILPFSSVEPFRVEDLCVEGIKKCYFLDFIGPKGFAAELSQQTMCQVIAFEHRKSVISKIPCNEDRPQNIMFHVDIEKSSSTAAYEYFSARISEIRSNDVSSNSSRYNSRVAFICSKLDSILKFGILKQFLLQGDNTSLLNLKERDRVEKVLKYIEDADLSRWSLADIKAFNLGLAEWRSQLSCITNTDMFNQLREISTTELIAKGNSQIFARLAAAKKLLDKVFRVRLGRGLYGECLGVRADGNSNLSDEIGKELSKRSVAVGLRPIGAVIYMQRKDLKMCLRSMDMATHTSEVAKAYGGGGFPCSSSFIIRMDEYNQWL